MYKGTELHDKTQGSVLSNNVSKDIVWEKKMCVVTKYDPGYEEEVAERE